MNNELALDDNVEDVALITCKRCGLQAVPHSTDRHMCVACVNAENSRLTYFRQHQDDWIKTAKEAGLEIWEQQPNETQWEFTIWTKYRDSYPGKRPSYSAVAQSLGTTYNVINKVAQRWGFPVRMQAWTGYCDKITLQQRRTEILDMNKEYIDMATSLRSKLKVSVDALDPYEVRARDLPALMKMVSAMEREARIDTMAQTEALENLAKDNENPDLKKGNTSQNDLQAVLDILIKAGALGSITQIGIKETTTVQTEVAISDGVNKSYIDITGGEDAG